MKKTLILVTVGAACVLLATAVPSVAAPPLRTIEVYAAAGQPTHVDELEPGIGPGDWLVFRDPVLDSGGERIGTAVTRVQVIAAAGEDDLAFILDCTVELDDGRLVFSGAEQFSHLETGVSYAVVGGTGSYAGASGQVHGEPAVVDGRPTSRLTFALARK